MRSHALSSLVRGAKPDPSRIFFHNIWYPEHNNARYAELLPRLDRLDAYLITCSGNRFVRRAQTRALSATQSLRGQIVFRLAARRYHSMLYTGNADKAVPQFRGRVIVDVDDPRFDDQEVRVLNAPNVRAYVVTAEWAAERYSSLGVTTPHAVIPQGANLQSLSEAQVSEVAATFRKPDTFVVGHMASALLTKGDRGGDNPLYNIDHLLDLWDEIRMRVPYATLWLVGQASRRVLHRYAGRDDVILFGRIPKSDVLSYVANFDLAIYARTQDQGVRAAKIADYMGAGVPTVSYDFRATEVIREYGAGILVRTPSEFVATVERLSRNRRELLALGKAAREAGKELDWDVLAMTYQREVLDKYLV